jgi:YfiH family protein
VKINYCFTDRYGGVSSPPYDSLNLALHVGDKPESVIKNRSIIQNRFNIKNIVWMDQVHKDRVETISSPHSEPIPACDAIITNKPNIALAVMVADCIPILMFDQKSGTISAIHAGRNGTFLEIAPKTIMKMQKEFNCNPSDIFVVMGPSIHSCCYEVSNEISTIVKNSFGKEYINDQMLDLQKLNYDQLIEANICKDHIKISNICTCCNFDYFSYRRDGITGRFAGVIWIKS